MTELMKIESNDNGEQVISGRELHEFLQSKQDFTTWIKSRIEKYGFIENQDFTLHKFMERKSWAHDYIFKIDIAKEIAMVEGNEKGKQARQYFISVEKAWNSPEMVMARGLKAANAMIDNQKTAILQLETKLEEQKPKVIFAEAVSVSHTSILVGELAKILKQNGIPDIGEKRLFIWLRENGYLIRRKGTDWNMPTQTSMEMALFEIKETVVNHSDGHTKINKTPKVTGKGQVYFVNKFLSQKVAI